MYYLGDHHYEPGPTIPVFAVSIQFFLNDECSKIQNLHINVNRNCNHYFSIHTKHYIFLIL